MGFTQDDKLDTWRRVETPEGVDLGLRVAGPAVRAGAWVMDAAVRMAIYMALGWLTAFLGDTGLALMTLSVFVGEWFYFVLFEVLRSGSTPGKGACGLRVIHRDGTPIGWSASVTRNLMRFADFFPFAYGFGLLSSLASPEFQRLGDRVAGTIVVYQDQVTSPQAEDGVTPLATPVALSAEEKTALLDFAERSDDWTRSRRLELAAILGPLTQAEGPEGLERLQGMAAWLRRSR